MSLMSDVYYSLFAVLCLRVKGLTSLTTLDLRHSCTFRSPNGKRVPGSHSVAEDRWGRRCSVLSFKLRANWELPKTITQSKYLFRIEPLNS
jgi:hypothetical protein